MATKSEWEGHLPWTIRRDGRRFVIRPLTDEAGLLMQEVRTPSSFARKRDAEAWLYGSLASHGLCDCMTEVDEDGKERVFTHSLGCPNHPEWDPT